jgi:hypothetical protein
VSNHLEQIVRPSQAPAIRPGPAVQIYTTPKIVENNPITWGSSGDSVFDLRAHASQTVNNSWPESSRTYDIVRVYNPDDREQFIDTEVMTEYQGRNKISQDRIKMQFATNTNTATTEVIQRGLTRKQPNST